MHLVQLQKFPDNLKIVSNPKSSLRLKSASYFKTAKTLASHKAFWSCLSLLYLLSDPSTFPLLHLHVFFLSLSRKKKVKWKIQTRWAWWCTPLIPALGRQRQADFWVQGQPVLQSEFQDSQGYTEKPCLKKQKQNHKTKKQNKTKQKNKKKKTKQNSNQNRKQKAKP